MKSILFSCCILLFSFVAKAQNPVKFTTKYDKATNTAIVHVQLEKGFHVFAKDAGGDGLAIPTIITIDWKDAKKKSIKKQELDDKNASIVAHEVTMEGFGVVRYYEGEFDFTVPVAPKAASASIAISYQICNDKMCLPPKDITLPLKISK
jgi:hypothetical protein